jgi:hypothetical protein
MIVSKDIEQLDIKILMLVCLNLRKINSKEDEIPSKIACKTLGFIYIKLYRVENTLVTLTWKEV